MPGWPVPDENPLVSAVIPTFNRAALLPIAIASVTGQTWRPLELVISNDGSTDDTLSVIEGLKPSIAAANVTLRVVTNPNGGRAAARNAGIDACTGDWVAHLDDDDRWLPEKTARQMQVLAQTGADAACCYLTKKTAEAERLHPAPPKRLIEGHDPAAWVRGETYAHINSIIWRRSLWPRVGPFDRELVKSQDVEWVGRLVHAARFCAVAESLGVYEFNPGGITRMNSMKDMIRADRFMAMVLLKIKQRNSTHESWDEQGWRDRAARDFDQFVKHLLYDGQLGEARELWRKAMQETGGHSRLKRTRGKLRKAAWLRLFGGKLKHPKLGDEVRL